MCAVTWEADGEDVLARCAVTGARVLVGRDEPEVTTHFTGTVRLAAAVHGSERTRSVPLGEADVVEASAIYDTYFHGPAYQVLKDAWRAEGAVAGRFAADLPPNHEPAERPTLVAPRLVELAFQTAGLAEIAAHERMGLPYGFERLELLRPSDGEVESAAVVRSRDGGLFDVEVADVEGRVLLSAGGLSDVGAAGRRARRRLRRAAADERRARPAAALGREHRGRRRGLGAGRGRVAQPGRARVAG